MRTLHLAVLLALAAPAAIAQNAVDVKPSPQQVAWQDMEMGAIIHFGTNTFLNREWGDGTASPSVFHPEHVDTDQWIEAAKSAGIRYVVLVAKHHDGFALYPTAQTDYSVKSSPWLGGKGDLVRMVSDSARLHGLRFGVYLSPWDRHDPRYKDPAAYDKYYLAMLEELASHYGELTEFWLDGAGSAGRTYDFDTIIDNLRTYQPNALVFADVGLFKYADLRWVGTESGKVDFENWNVVDRAGYLRWRPVEADTPLHTDHWFWHPNDEASLKPVNELVKEYDQTVGRGAQLMLGLAPDDTGRLPAADVARLKEFGERLRQIYGNNLAVHAKYAPDTAAAFDGDASTYWQAPVPAAGNVTPAVLTVEFAQPVTFDRTLIMERLDEGQHVTAHRIEVEEHGQWRQVAQAQAIGHKKIDIFPAVTATAVRLVLLDNNGPARIREFQVYDGSAAY
jgi:alpha-L-fucosidase